MATSKKMQERKKKKAEQKAKEKVLKNRAELRAAAKEEKQKEMQYELEFEERNGKQYPIINDPNKKQEFIAGEQNKINKQLENNVKILEALEAEYLREQEIRNTLNKKLEEEGCHTLEEKMAYLNQNTIKKPDSKENEDLLNNSENSIENV
jgi:hypothetical protein